MFALLFRSVRFGALPAALWGLALAGCGSSPPPDEPPSESQAADQKKIQELSKKGYDFREIRAIVSGEEPEPRAEKKAGRGRR